jgi:ribonucleases P/MRP protein subunit RPP40
VYFNARSLVKKTDWLEALKDSLDPDIIGITETWCNDNISDAELAISGYDMFRRDRIGTTRGGGVLLYVRSSLNATAVALKAEGEQVCCSILNEKRDELVICVCYRSSNRLLFNNNSKTVREAIIELQNKNLLLVGDFNYPDINWMDGTCHNTDSEQFITCLEDCFLTQHVMAPTRGENCLDLVITRDPDIVNQIDVVDTFCNSDHNIITFNVKFSNNVEAERRGTYDYNKADFEGMRSELSHLNWSGLWKGRTKDDWETFSSKLLTLQHKHVPYKKRSVKRKKAIWINHKAIKAVVHKRKMYTKYRNVDHPAYIKASRAAKKSLRNARQSFETKLAQKVKEDTKSFYSYVRSKTKSKVRVGPLVEAGTVSSSDIEMSEAFNEYFVTVFTVEDCSVLPIPRTMYTGSEQDKLSVIEVTEETVAKKLALLRADKAQGADDLSPRLLKEVRTEISSPLLHIWRESLQDGCVPEGWKTANVCPIFKKGSRSQAGNYRPVSLTSQISKLLEAVIRDALVNHLEKNKLVSESQHGFRRGRSCLSNVLVFLDKVSRWVDEGDCVDAIYLDFAKAFDKVPHKRLIMKLESHGVSGSVLRWIEEWLKGRKQRVCVNGSFSGWRDVTSGVPQGSVLGPVLFLIYINDLDSELLSWVLKFADDTKLYGRANSEIDRRRIQMDLNKLETWSKDWQMSFNIEKCKVMHIGKQNPTQKYYLNGQALSNVKEETDLGITITADLKPSKQCRTVYTKACRVLGMIHRTIKNRDKTTLLCLYKSLVRPLLEYAVPAWSPHYVKDKSLLERAQHRFTRMVRNLRKLDYMDRLKALSLWTLEERRNRADLIETFKILRGYAAVSMEQLFELSNQRTTRGHTLKLAKHRCNSDLRKYFFSERVVNRWNNLDQKCVDSSSINEFKGNLKRIRSTRMGFFMD